MNRCETCKYWERDPGKDTGDCDMTITYRGKPEYKNSKAFVHGGDYDHASWIKTTHDFGCVQWDAKDVTWPERMQYTAGDVPKLHKEG